MVRKGFGIRLGAFLIDIVILAVVLGVVSLILGGGFGFRVGTPSFPADGSVTPEMISRLVMIFLVQQVLSLAYLSTDVFLLGTPGKKILKLSIASETGAPAVPAQLWARFATKNVGTLLGLLAMIPFLGFISILGMLASFAVFVGCFLTLGAKRQALHDVLAKTAVYGPGTAAVAPGFAPVMPGQVPYSAAPGQEVPPPQV